MAIMFEWRVVSLKEYNKLQRQKNKPKNKGKTIVGRKGWWLDREPPYDSYDWTILSEPEDWNIRVSFLNRRTNEIGIKTIDIKKIRLN